MLHNLMSFDEYDVIVQSVETPPLYGYGWKESTSTFVNCEYPEWAPRECTKMYNCGVVGINNENLKRIPKQRLSALAL